MFEDVFVRKDFHDCSMMKAIAYEQRKMTSDVFVTPKIKEGGIVFVRELPRRMSRERGAKIHDGIPVHTPPTPSSLINNLYLYTTNTYHVHHTNSLR